MAPSLPWHCSLTLAVDTSKLETPSPLSQNPLALPSFSLLHPSHSAHFNTTHPLALNDSDHTMAFVNSGQKAWGHSEQAMLLTTEDSEYNDFSPTRSRWASVR